jgi:hypothetical protein
MIFAKTLATGRLYQTKNKNSLGLVENDFPVALQIMKYFPLEN